MSVYLLLGSLLIAIQLAGGEETNIVYDDPDVSTIIEGDSGEFQLEAFKAVDNDRVLQSNGTLQSSQLSWFSMGEPKLMRVRDRRNPSSEVIFDLKFDRASVQISTLTALHRELLAAAASKKHQVTVVDDQILNLPLSHVDCLVVMMDDSGQNFVLTGSAANLQTFPIRVDFMAPRTSPERQMLEHMIKERMDELAVECTFAAKGKKLKTNVLETSPKQIEQLGLVDKLFGLVDQVSVTREQLLQLSSEVYSALSIRRDYEMPEYQFSQAFVGGLLQQTRSGSFSDESVDDALSVLSRYATGDDVNLSSESIKRDLSSLLIVRSAGNRRQIVLNQQAFVALRQREGSSSSNPAIVSFFGIRIGAKSKILSRDLVSPTLSLDDQLAELNSFQESDVRWAIDGNSVVPTTIRVARLYRRNFHGALRFSDVLRETTVAPFSRVFRLETANTEQMASLWERVASQQKEQQKAIAKLEAFVEGLSWQQQWQHAYPKLKHELEVMVGPMEQQLQRHEQLQQQATTTLESVVAAQTAQQEQRQAVVTTLESAVEELTKQQQLLLQRCQQLEEQQRQSVAKLESVVQDLTKQQQLLLQRHHQLEEQQQQALSKMDSAVEHLSHQVEQQEQQLQTQQQAIPELESAFDRLTQQLLQQQEQLNASVHVKIDPLLPEVPQVPQVLEVSQVPEVLQVLQVPQVSQVPQVLQVPQVPQVIYVPQMAHPLTELMRNTTEEVQHVKNETVLEQMELPHVIEFYEQHPDHSFWESSGYTILHFVSERGSLARATELLSQGVDVNAASTAGWTALHNASAAGRVEMVQLLLDNGAAVNAKNGDGRTALHLASMRGHPAVATLLLDHGADVNAKENDGKTPLHLASLHGRLDVVKTLLQRGADIEVKDTSYWDFTPLHWASMNGHVDVIKALLDKGANANTEDSTNWTPLHWASSNGDVATVKALLDQGADIEAISSYNATPLIEASSSGRLEVVKVLLDRGANINARDSDGETSLSSATAKGKTDVAALLKERGGSA